jgi:hypothetical protein
VHVRGSDPSEPPTGGARDDEDEWSLPRDAHLDPGKQFKWGVNGHSAEATVWPVSGPGDGRPTHAEYLRQVWGRDPAGAAGDVLGFATLQSRRVVVHAYYGRRVPAPVVSWFEESYPSITVTVTEPNS